MASTVWYIGIGSQRHITSADWARFGIEAEDTAWKAENGWAVPTADLTEDQINVLESMRNEFSTGQDGPRVWPAPDRIQDINESSYIYYARIVEMYASFVTGTGRGSKWFSGSGLPGVVVGALPGDFYLNTQNGNVYELS